MIEQICLFILYDSTLPSENRSISRTDMSNSGDRILFQADRFDRKPRTSEGARRSPPKFKTL